MRHLDENWDFQYASSGFQTKEPNTLKPEKKSQNTYESDERGILPENPRKWAKIPKYSRKGAKIPENLRKKAKTPKNPKKWAKIP